MGMERLNAQPTTRSRHHRHLAKYDNLPGIYVLYDASTKQCYIGVSKNLGMRLRSHSNKYAGWAFVVQRLPLDEARAKERDTIQRFERKGFSIINRRHRLYERHPSVSPQLVYRRKRRGWTEEDANRTPRDERYVPRTAR